MLAEPKQVVPSWWLTSGPITVANDSLHVAVVKGIDVLANYRYWTIRTKHDGSP
jgi:hypothetical protein